MTYSISLLHSINPLFFALLFLIALLLGKSIYTLKTFPELKKKSIREIIVGSLVLVIVLGLFVVTPLLSRIKIADDHLDVRLASGFTSLSLAKEAIISAQVLDLDPESDFFIDSKVVGTATRNYYEGLFNLSDGRQAGVLVNGKQALFIETAEENLLLAPDHFDAFVKDFSETLFPLK